MNLTLSPPVRILALAGLVLAAAGGGAMLLLERSTQTTSGPPAPARTTTPPRAAYAARPTTPGQAASRQAARTRRAAHRGNLVYATLPRPLQWQLSRHRVVVVSFYNPRSDVDAISVAEAHAGAVDAKVGFLLVDVLDDAIAGPLTALLPGGGLLPDPGILVYRAPGDLVYRFDGFLDRAAVAQAATNAATASGTGQPVATP